MKKLLLVLNLSFILIPIYSQIGINTNTPDEDAVLEIFSDTKGLLIPRLEKATREGLGDENTPEGLIVYDLTLQKFFVWKTKSQIIPDPDPELKSGTKATGNWHYIDPWEINDQDGIMRLSSSVADRLYMSADLYVSGNIKVNAPSTFEGYGTIPIGGIIMWSGDPTNLPDGWELCNGGTFTDWEGNKAAIPDLSGRFIVSYGQNSSPHSRETDNTNYVIGEGTGINKYLLSPLESGLRQHNHPFGGTTAEISLSHSHTYTSYDNRKENNDGLGDRTDVARLGGTRTTSGVTQSHSHSFSGTTENRGNYYAVDAHENRPPYYVLAFIIRTK